MIFFFTESHSSHSYTMHCSLLISIFWWVATRVRAIHTDCTFESQCAAFFIASLCTIQICLTIVLVSLKMQFNFLKRCLSRPCVFLNSTILHLKYLNTKTASLNLQYCHLLYWYVSQIGAQLLFYFIVIICIVLT